MPLMMEILLISRKKKFNSRKSIKIVMRKKIRISFVIVFLVLSKLVCGQGTVIDEVVWVVGDDAILRSDVEKQILQMKYEKVDMQGDPYCVIPEQLAIRKLFLHQAKLDSLEANEGGITMQVEQRIGEILDQIGSEERLEEYYGKTIKQIKEELREQAREQSIVQQMQQKLIGDKKISPSSVRKYFSQIDSVDIPFIADKTEIQILTIEPAIPPQEVEAIKTKLRGFKERIESGDATFSMLAMLYSDDVESAKQGGELGFMGKGQLVKPFADEAFTLTDPNKVSRIVETEFGYHILQLIEKRGDKVNVRHILIKPKPQLEDQSKAMAKLDSIIGQVRENKLTFENAVLLFSEDKNTRMSSGLMVNLQDGTSRFEYKEMPPEIARLATNMQVGEISKPFIMKNQAGKQVCAVIKIKAKIAKHKANLDDDYQLLKTFVQNRQNAEILEKWIQNKQEEIYVRINPDWQNCTFQYSGWIKK